MIPASILILCLCVEHGLTRGVVGGARSCTWVGSDGPGFNSPFEQLVDVSCAQVAADSSHCVILLVFTLFVSSLFVFSCICLNH
jgi:hypothetical protein